MESPRLPLRSWRGLRPAFPVVEAGAGHALAQAAFFDEVLLQAANQLVQQVVGLVNQAEGNVGEDAGRRTSSKKAACASA